MRWMILFLLFIGMIVNFADKSIIGLAATSVMEDLQLGPAQWGIVGSAYYWLYPITGVIGAAYADKLGAKKILSFLMLTWAVLQFGVIIITALPLLILYRILLGVFEGPFSPVAYAHADKWFPANLKAFANSVLVTGGTIGALVIAPLLVAMITAFGWKIAFAILGAVSVIWFFLFIFFTKESPAEACGKEKSKVKLEKLTLHDLKYIASSKTVLFTTLAYFSTYCFVVWNATWLPLYLVDGAKLTQKQMGFSVAIIGVTSIVIYMAASTISDYTFKRTNNWKISRIYITGASMIIGALSMLSVIVWHNPVWIVMALSLSKGLTYAIIPAGPTIIINEMPKRRSLMTSILTSSGNLAGILMPLVTGFVVSLASTKTLGYSLSIIVMAALVLICATLFILFTKPVVSEK